MKISEVRKELDRLENEHGDIGVMFVDPNARYGPFSVETVRYKKSQGQYPDDFNMPEGHEFIEIDTF